MAQLTYVGQGQHAAFGPLVASAMLMISLVFALLGIKIWGFRRRLTFDRGGQSTARTSQQQSQPAAPRYAAFESQVTGTDNAVYGVFRQRNIEEFESARPTNLAANKYLTGSAPNLQLATLISYQHRDEEMGIPEMSGTAPYRPEPRSTARRRRLQVYSANYDNYATPPTRQPPAPPIEVEVVAAEETNSQLNMPAFDHFAEKYELISAKTATEQEEKETAAISKESQLLSKKRGIYVKYEQVDDVPELLTPDDDQVGAAISVAAQVHHVFSKEPVEAKSTTAPNNQLFELEHKDSAFVVEIIPGTPDTIGKTEPVIARNLFDSLEMAQHMDDVEFERIRSSYEMNEADLLDMTPDFAGLQVQLAVPGSPPGFGKSIDDDWENFENLENVANVPEPNWLVHPAMLDLPQEEVASNLENVVQPETLFQQLELMELSEDEQRAQLTNNYSDPPPYEIDQPVLAPILPDYDSLMQLESSQRKLNLPNYVDVLSFSQRKINNAKFVNSIEDLFVELQVNGDAPIDNSIPHAEEVRDFEELCEVLDIVPSPIPARRPPQPAPRAAKPTTLNVRGDAPPLTCYTPEELPSSSSSEAEVEEAAAPAPAKRSGRTLKVRFDVENLQYYQSAEVPSSNESEVECENEDEEKNKSHLPPSNTQRLIPVLPADEQLINVAHDVPKLFGTQVSQDDSDEESFGRTIRQHRSMTEALRPVLQSDKVTEA